MSDPRRFLLWLVTGLLLFAGLTVIAVEETAPVPAAAAESPILQVAPTTTVPPTTVAPTTVPETTTTALPAPAKVSGGAVAPPRNAYAPEPIQEIGRIEIPKIGLRHQVFHGGLPFAHSASR